MRPVLAAQLCLAVFQAFLLAPAQHVHDAEDEAHEHSTLVHSHFAAHTVLPVRPGEVGISESEEQEAWTLDTFTIVLAVGFHPVLLSRAPDALFPLRTVGGAAARVEERAHDPPDGVRSIPRAPPA